MTDTFGGDAVAAALGRAAARLRELREWLTELDAAMGDGDMGINLAKGAAGLEAYLEEHAPEGDLGRFLFGAGMAFNRAAPSTLGTLLATGLMRAGKECQGFDQLDARLLTKMLVAADEGIQERGKAKPGDKTVVDALHPAAEAFAAAIERGEDLTAASHKMLEAGREGRDAVIPLQSQVGRASWVGERTRNQPDPGTVALVQVMESVLGAEYSRPGSTQGGQIG